jgi:hypothetical protein
VSTHDRSDATLDQIASHQIYAMASQARDFDIATRFRAE